MDSGVGKLHVHVRPPPGAEIGLQETAERFSRRVLERLAERLNAEAPEQLVFIRELSLRWRLGDRQLEDGVTAEQCAGEIVERVRDAMPLGLEISAPYTADDLAIFRDESHWRAAYLLSRARGAHSRAWFFKALEQESDPLGSLGAPEKRQLAWAVLERLAAAGHLIEVINVGPRGNWTALAERVLDTQSFPSPLTGLSTSSIQTSSVPEGLIRVTRSLPADLPHTLVALVLHAHARALAEVASDEITPLVQHCLALREKIRKVDETNFAGQANPTAEGIPPESASSEQDAPDRKRDDQHPAPEAAGADAALVPVQLGGLFYLLNCALELNLGETLWKACLPEQKIFAHVVAALVGKELKDDRSIPMFAGCGPDPPVPIVSEDQLDEMSEALLNALCASLPRRGLAPWPQIVLSLEHHDNGYLFVARPLSNPFVIFARPTPAPEADWSALKAFLSGWSRSAPAPLASPGLVELDASGCVRLIRQAETQPAPLLPETHSVESSALLAQTIGVLCCLLQARTGMLEEPSANSFVEQFIQLPARVLVTTEELTVTMPADAAKLALRRAGLDRDPGWVPWLQKTVRFEFVASDEGVKVPD